MFEAGVEDIFYPAKFGPPDFSHVVEAPIDSGFKGREAEVHHGTENHEHYGVRNHRNADGEVELCVRHDGSDPSASRGCYLASRHYYCCHRTAQLRKLQSTPIRRGTL